MNQIIATIQHTGESNLYKLYEGAFQMLGKSDSPQSLEKKYREQLQSFNETADILKTNIDTDGIILNSVQNNKYRLAMVDHITHLEKEIKFLVGVYQHKQNDQNAIQKSLRLTEMAAIKDLLHINNKTPLTAQALEELQHNITLMADFSIDKNGNRDITESTTLFSTSIDRNTLDAETQALLEAKLNFETKRKRQAKEQLEQIILQRKQEKENKLEEERLAKEKRLEEKRLEQEKLNLEKQKMEDAAQIAKEEERIEQDRLAKLELAQKEAEKILTEKLKLEDEKLEVTKKEKERIELEEIKRDRLYKEKIEKDRIESEKTKTEQLILETERLKLKKLENEQKISELQKQATMRRYMWAGVGIIGLTAAAIMYYYNLHAKYIPWLSRA